MVLMTEWKPFRHPDFSHIKKIMKTAVIFDGRNQYDPVLLRDAGFEYSGIGR
jgi:UDPglucose 6-dehydrogenase